jgi:hypothetical protein
MKVEKLLEYAIRLNIGSVKRRLSYLLELFFRAAAAIFTDEMFVAESALCRLLLRCFPRCLFLLLRSSRTRWACG